MVCGRLLADLSAEEEGVADSRFTVLVSGDGAARGVHKMGGGAVDEAVVREAMTWVSEHMMRSTTHMARDGAGGGARKRVRHR